MAYGAGKSVAEIGKGLALALREVFRGKEEEKEEEGEERKVVFVGHSMGGLVVMAALEAIADLASTSTTIVGTEGVGDGEEDDITTYKTLRTACIGAIFLGVPLSGSAATIWASLATKFLRGLGSDSTLLSTLGLHSQELRRLRESFEVLYLRGRGGRGGFRVFCFYETRKVIVGGWVGLVKVKFIFPSYFFFLSWEGRVKT